VLGVFLDIETNGLNPLRHQALEIAFHIIHLPSFHTVCEYASIVKRTEEEWENSDQTSLQINGFSWADLQQGKPPHLISQEIQDIFSHHHVSRGQAVFICQNPSFDRAFFSQFINPDIQEQKKWPYHWLDLASMHWTRSLLAKKQNDSLPYPWADSLSKDTIATWYQLPQETKPHRAQNGVRHLILCYQAVIDSHF